MNKELAEHWNELRLLFRGGKLWNVRSEGFYGERLEGKNKWRNSVEHQVTQLTAARALRDLLGLSDEEGTKLEKTAIVHDWGKRMGIDPCAFTDTERERAKILLSKVNPDPDLMNATGPQFLQRVLAGKASFLEFVQFYLDDITKGSEIVSFDERIDEVSARRQDLDEDQKMTEALGGRKYWTVEREIGHTVERMIFDRLVERGIKVSSPKEIPSLIRNKMEEQANV